MKYPKLLAAAKAEQIPFVAEEMLTASAGYLVSEEVAANIEAALVAAETNEATADLQAQLDAANASLAIATQERDAANASLTAVQAELATAIANLATAQASATDWEAKAKEFGARPADVQNPAKGEADADADDADVSLANLEHNRKADRLLG